MDNEIEGKAHEASEREDKEPEIDVIARWKREIEAARKDEAQWRDEAKKSMRIFRADKSEDATAFNLFHSNVSIIVPSAFNSMPIPDVRRRFSDDDPVGRTVSEVLERALSYTIDENRYDQHIRRALYDTVICGRGLTRTRVITTDDGKAEATTECVQWDRFVRGPGASWDDVPWIAFEHYLDKEAIERLNPDLAETDSVPFTYSADASADDDNRGGEEDKRYKRARVYEIWDKHEKQVLFICPECEYIIATMDDPLGLKGFWPIPEPIYAIEPVGGLTPVCPYGVYEGLVNELNVVSKRITNLVRQLRPRGGFMGVNLDLERISIADDGELVALQGAEGMLTTSALNINNLITWFPMEPIVLAIRELMTQREMIKATIYEVTGISDIVRGASDPRETLGAQNLKAQFGSVRVRTLQNEVARYIRDDLRIKAEIIAKMYQPETIMDMTGIYLLPRAAKQQLMQMQQAAQQDPAAAQQLQAMVASDPRINKAMGEPAAEDVFELLASDKMRGYRIDIETDSTIQGDVSKFQQEMATFLQGTGQFLAAIGPMVQQGAVPAEAAVEIYTGFARNFRLGKSAEDALEKLAERAAEQGMPNPQQQQAEAAKEQRAVEQQKAQQDGQLQAMKLQLEQAKMQLEEQRIQLEAAGKAKEFELKQYEIELRDKLERDKAMLDAQLRQEQAAANAKPATVVSLDANSAMGQFADTLSNALAAQDGKLSETQAMLADVANKITAPRRIVRDPMTGRAIGAETVI